MKPFEIISKQKDFTDRFEPFDIHAYRVTDATGETSEVLLDKSATLECVSTSPGNPNNCHS